MRNNSGYEVTLYTFNLKKKLDLEQLRSFQTIYLYIKKIYPFTTNVVLINFQKHYKHFFSLVFRIVIPLIRLPIVFQKFLYFVHVSVLILLLDFFHFSPVIACIRVTFNTTLSILLVESIFSRLILLITVYSPLLFFKQFIKIPLLIEPNKLNYSW